MIWSKCRASLALPNPKVSTNFGGGIQSIKKIKVYQWWKAHGTLGLGLEVGGGFFYTPPQDVVIGCLRTHVHEGIQRHNHSTPCAQGVERVPAPTPCARRPRGPCARGVQRVDTGPVCTGYAVNRHIPRESMAYLWWMNLGGLVYMFACSHAFHRSISTLLIVR